MITVAGEALIDLVGEGGDRYRALPGGGPCNIAVALSRLGQPTSLLARMSGDGFGRQLRTHLEVNKVPIRDVHTVPEPSTLAVVNLDGGGQASYDFYVTGTADWQWTPDELSPLDDEVDALAVGTLAMMLPPGAAVLEDFVRSERARGRVTIVYDPNLRPRLSAGREAERVRVERQTGLTDVLKVSEEDLAWLYPERDPTDPDELGELAGYLRSLGPRLVVVTRGADGAYALGPDGAGLSRKSPVTDVVDTVGAGDAFCAGLLAAMREASLLGAAGRNRLGRVTSAELAPLLDHAALVAALTCGRAGADPPTESELTAAMGRLES